MGLAKAIVGLVLVLIIVGVVVVLMQPKTPPPQLPPKQAQQSTQSIASAAKPSSVLSQPQAPPPVVIKPRPKVVNDCGYNTNARGWYDAQGQGPNNKNDFCRHVGNDTTSWFACQLAGKSPADGPGWHLTEKGKYDHLIGKDYEAGTNGIEQCTFNG